MGRYNASPSTFSQGGTSDPRKLGFGFSDEKPSSFGRNGWSRNAARRALRLSGQRGPMCPQRFADILQLLGLRVRVVAAALGAKDIEVRRWRSGHADIPPLVAAALEGLAANSE